MLLPTGTLVVIARGLSPLGFGTGFINGQRSSIEFLTVQGSDCILRVGILQHFDESKTFRLP